MARHPQPIEVAKFKGAHKKDPQRYQKDIPKLDMPLGKYPEHLSPGAKKVWFELEAYALPGVLTATDRLAFEILSELIAEYRMAPVNFKTGRINTIISLMARLGFTVADRQKLGVDKDKKENRFARWV